MEENTHYSGFINIIGKPNVGKSTLMNLLVGERMSIITHKPQTTRHRILGMVNGDDYQMVFSDTPGIIDDPKYKMQEVMNRFVRSAFEDADIMVFMVDAKEGFDESHPLLALIKRPLHCPLFLVINKTDLVTEEQLSTLQKQWSAAANFDQIFSISALNNVEVDTLFDALRQALPEGPVYFPKDQFTDRSERFLVSEIIREQILEQYYQEIPYSTEVVVEAFQRDEEDNIVRIRALIFVARDSQKNIIIGKKGSAIKQVGIESRKSIEQFLEQKVYLELFVKVKSNWRDDENLLKRFGYQ